MKKAFSIFVVLLVSMVLSSTLFVNAAEVSSPPKEYVAQDQTQTSISELPGYAYAVLQAPNPIWDDEYELIFFRSYDTYTSGSQRGIEDIFGNTYSGVVFPVSESGEECPKPWLDFAPPEQIRSVRVASGQIIAPSDLSGFFEGCFAVTEMNIQGLSTANTQSLKAMFRGCNAVSGLDLSSFDTHNITDMSYMFSGCGAKSLDLSGFDTSNVVDMSYMFSGCGAKSLDLSGFDTSNVVNMDSMFRGCAANSIDLSLFDTHNVQNMQTMFAGCRSLTALDLTGFDTSSVTVMNSNIEGIPYGMFYDCISLSEIKFGAFDTGNISDMQGMFYNCRNLTNLDLSSFDTSDVTSMRSMFSYCGSLTELDLSGFDTSNVTEMEEMFYNCTSLTSLDISGFDTDNVTNMDGMFYLDQSLREIVLGKNFTNWLDSSYLTAGMWYKDDLSFSETDLYTYYPSHSSEWAGKWIRHKYEEPSYTWATDILTATAVAYDSVWDESVSETVATTYEITVPATCGSPGKALYHADFTNSLFSSQVKEVELPTTGHDFELYDWTWADDYTSATATFTCKNDPAHVETVTDEEITVLVVDDKTVYIAEVLFEGKIYNTTETVLNGYLTMEETSIEIPLKTTYQLYVDSNLPIIWTSSSSSVATVDDNGSVNPLYPGKTTITATADQGEGKEPLTVSCDVQVTFIDVTDHSTFFFDPVYWAVEEGITGGYTGDLFGYFGPDDDCTRAQIVTFLYRAADSPAIDTSNAPKFKDVKKSDYFYKAVVWAAQNNITTGYTDSKGKPTGYFGSNDRCTRGQIVTFLYRWKGEPAIDSSNLPAFKDVKKNDYFYEAVVWAAQNNITTGYSKTKFAPNDTCLRGQVVTFLYRAR